MKNKKILLIIVFIALILCAGVVFMLGNHNNTNNINVTISNRLIESDNNCILKGNLCNDKQLIEGVKVSVSVSDNKSVEFYVLNNTEDEINLISAENISDGTNWSEYGNAVGPINIFKFLTEYTSTWNKISNIKDYLFYDTGYKNYYDACLADSKTNDNNYDCDSGWDDRGYEYLEIKDGTIIIKNKLNMKGTTENLKVRIPEKTELLNLMAYNEKIKWLQDTKDFWLLDTATSKDCGYNSSAYSVTKTPNTDSGISIKPQYTKNSNQTVGLRAVLHLVKE